MFARNPHGLGTQKVEVGVASAASIHDFGQIAGEVKSAASIEQAEAGGGSERDFGLAGKFAVAPGLTA